MFIRIHFLIYVMWIWIIRKSNTNVFTAICMYLTSSIYKTAIIAVDSL